MVKKREQNTHLFSEKTMQMKTFISICSIVFAVMLALVSLMFIWFRKKTENSYRDLAMVAVSNTDTVWNQYIETCDQFVKNWYTLTDGTECRMSDSYNIAENMALLSDIKEMVSPIPYVQSVKIINRYGKETLSYGTGISNTEELTEPFMEEIKKQGAADNCLAWKVKHKYKSEKEIVLFSVYYQEASPGTEYYSGTVVMHMDAKILANSIFSSSNQADFIIFILDEEGRVVLSSTEEFCGEDWSEKSFVQEILAGEKVVSNALINDERELEVVGRPSERSGYYVAAAMEPIGMMSEVVRLLDVILIVMLIFSALIVLITRKVCEKLYRPFYGMLSDFHQTIAEDGENKYVGKDEMDFLRKFYHELTNRISALNQKTEKDVFVKNLLNGNKDQSIQNYLTENKMIRQGRGYYLVLVYFFRLEHADDDNEFEMLQNTIGSIYAAVLSEIGTFSHFELDRRKSLMIVSEKEDFISKEQIFCYLQRAWKKATEMEGNVIYTAVSGKMEASRPFRVELFQKMNENIKIKQFLGEEGQVFRIGEEVKEFPKECSDRMLSAIEHRNPGLYREAVEDFVGICVDCSYHDFVTWNTTAAERITKQFQQAMAGRNTRWQNLEQIKAEVCQIENREALIAWFEELYQEITSHLDKADVQASVMLMEKVVGYIQEHYGDGELNVNMLADMFGISAAYFGKQFKQYTGMSMVEYLKKIRLEKARRMLLEDPEKGITQVAEVCGFGSAAYFATTFKKYYGVSPSKLREAIRLEKEQRAEKGTERSEEKGKIY